ncbi:hypothetical protein [Pseudoxanthomonas broegbernensis]|nr:hypothetical protein [Pseudoxanthomonas broegbernensis]MBB6064003.1 TPR repeat protein [Pseudoxanthomonas broegbernensis]
MPASPPTRSAMAPGALERLQARFEQAEAARTGSTSPDAVIHGHGGLYPHASMAGIAKAAHVLAGAYDRQADAAAAKGLDPSLVRKRGHDALARAAALGLDAAQYELALACATPFPAQARQWMHKAADQGHAPARQWLQRNP